MVGLSLIRELGPVITALLVIGRAGSSTAAEIGAMVATEQLDGIRMLSIDPVHHCKAAGAGVVHYHAAADGALYYLRDLWRISRRRGAAGRRPGKLYGKFEGVGQFPRRSCREFDQGALVFGFLLAVIATYRGYTSAPTSEGVSNATTSTVVISSVTVLLFDYVITALWGV